MCPPHTLLTNISEPQPSMENREVLGPNKLQNHLAFMNKKGALNK